jgi:tripartite-type tricarboxylate transporter receptor subunit TctC
VTTAAPLDLLPDVPTVGQFLPGYEASGWLGIGAPRSTPPEIIARLNKEIDAAIAAPEMKARLSKIGDVTFASSPADFGKFIADETEKWGKVIRAANIKAE